MTSSSPSHPTTRLPLPPTCPIGWYTISLYIDQTGANVSSSIFVSHEHVDHRYSQAHELAELASNPLVNACYAREDPMVPAKIGDLSGGLYGTGGGDHEALGSGEDFSNYIHAHMPTVTDPEGTNTVKISSSQVQNDVQNESKISFRKRWYPTEEQKQILINAYVQHKYPTLDQVIKLVKILNTFERKTNDVKVGAWFKNRRKRENDKEKATRRVSFASGSAPRINNSSEGNNNPDKKINYSLKMQREEEDKDQGGEIEMVDNLNVLGFW
ncbi:hypothetical protein NE237_026834 [Protea cynaroides]|uniref:Homeobox domain-containing protein n=1 Tax=Protea cynaroides TaxID=273540 RepID=A0A9Q0GLE3_9MAGN|nr:hypothetical protein NE237_026834 [Protea cynaroides]